MYCTVQSAKVSRFLPFVGNVLKVCLHHSESESATFVFLLNRLNITHTETYTLCTCSDYNRYCFEMRQTVTGPLTSTLDAPLTITSQRKERLPKPLAAANTRTKRDFCGTVLHFYPKTEFHSTLFFWAERTNLSQNSSYSHPGDGGGGGGALMNESPWTVT